MTIANTKYRQTSNQININLHTRGLFISVLCYPKQVVQLWTKNCKKFFLPKDKKKAWTVGKQISWVDSDMTQMLGLSDKECRITMINMLSVLNEKNK